MKTSGLVLTALAWAGCFFLASCEKEPQVEPQAFNFELDIPNAMNKKGLVLKELGAPVKKIEGVPEWLTAYTETRADGIPVLWVTFDRYDKFERREGVITLSAKNGSKAVVAVFQQGEGDGGDEGTWWNSSPRSWGLPIRPVVRQ